MKIKCKVVNVTMVDKIVYSQSTESPLIVFIARDHYYNEPILQKLKNMIYLLLK